MKNNILIQAWALYKFNNKFYIEYTHNVYITEIHKIYKKIYLISPVKTIDVAQVATLCEIQGNIEVIELPFFKNYLQAYKYFFSYISSYRKLKKLSFDTVYSRFPSPFGWLQKIYFKEKRVIHFVGDPIDTVENNRNLSIAYRKLKIYLFSLEYYLFIWASKGRVKVVSNGHHLSNKLRKFNINAKPLISTTLNDTDFFYKDITKDSNVITLIYVGYLRKAKGVDTIIQALKIISQSSEKKYKLTIVGDGEEKDNLRNLAKMNDLDVVFTGHIDDRNILNSLLRSSDIFCFASLSEGSPRVVLEAIANGINVISTPVGSLPYVFTDKEEILYFNFNNFEKLAELIEELSLNYELRLKLLKNSQQKVLQFKIDSFINEAFNA